MKTKAQRLKEYRQTPKGKACQIWSALLQRVGNKSGRSRTYTDVQLLMTRDEFYEWAIPRIEEWIKTKPLKDISLDRTVEGGHYELSNLQFLTRIENTMKQRRYKNVNAPTGKSWCSGCKDYLELDKFGKDCYSYNGKTHKCTKCVKERDRARYLRLTKQ